MNSTEKLTKVLRWSGGGAMILSAIHFMMAGRYDMNSLTAHYLFLGLNALLCVLGILSARKLKENKSARTFIGLSLAMVPAQMAQLGAFVFSRFKEVPEKIPDLMKFSLPNDANLIAIATISMVVLLPIIYLGFSILFSSERRHLSLTYLATSLSLLLPFRDSHSVGIVLAITSLLIHRSYLKMPKLKTFEARVSKLLLLIPSAIVLGRSLLYPMDSLLYAYLFGLMTVFLFFITPKLLEKGTLLNTSQFMSFITMILTVVCLSIKHSIAFHYSTLIIVGLLSVMSHLSIGNNRGIRCFAAITLGMSMLGFSLVGNAFVSTLAILLPLTLVLTSLHNKEKVPLAINSVTLIWYAGWKILTVFSFPQIGTWQALAVCGVLLILGAGVLERHFIAIKSRVSLFLSESN